MTRRTFWPRTAAALSALILIAACSEPTPPSAQASAGTAALSRTTMVGDTTVTVFTYDYLLGTTEALGVHKIVMPAMSVCEPLTSSYGVGTWDLPCTVASRNLTITAKAWTTAGGRARVDFEPALRFAPTDDSKRFVKLFFKDKDATDAALAEQLHIDWVPFVGAPPVDEQAIDPTLRTQVSVNAGMVWRRVKHFSGYMVASGRSTELTVDASLDGGL